MDSERLAVSSPTLSVTFDVDDAHDRVLMTQLASGYLEDEADCLVKNTTVINISGPPTPLGRNSAEKDNAAETMFGEYAAELASDPSSSNSGNNTIEEEPSDADHNGDCSIVSVGGKSKWQG